MVSASVLGAGVTVRSGARVSGSVLLDGVEVRAGAGIDGSVVGRDSVVGQGAALSAVTVVGCSARVPDGAVLADARFPAP
jgi:ADP-glucose pyrophosphorylase